MITKEEIFETEHLETMKEEEIIKSIKKIINDLECKCETLNGIRPKWIDAEELLKKLEEIELK